MIFYYTIILKNRKTVMSKQFLLEIFEKNKDSIIEKTKLVKSYCKNRSNFDFVTIIPKFGRDSHFDYVMHNLKKRNSEDESSHKIIVVEHSEKPDSLEKCALNEIDYIHIPKNEELFNKCISMNIGSFLHQAKYFHFHDIDLYIPKDFWKKIKINIKNNIVIQAFTKRRVNYIDEAHSLAIFRGKINILEVIAKRGAWKTGRPGAPGGSIVISPNLFNSLGGFDPYYFVSYSSEDAFFVDKIQTVTKFFGADSPPIEMFHLWHPSNEKATPEDLRKLGEKIRKYFLATKMEEKKELINLYKNFLIEQKNVFEKAVQNTNENI